MIVGNGLLSTAFSQYVSDDGVIIFASGVSNSKETSLSEFNREISLLREYLSLEKRIVYFSTCSVLDVENNTPYVIHKRFIESLISQESNNYLIFRLPIIISESTNKNTFFNNIRIKIIRGDEIEVMRNATRYLIDIDDIKTILPKIIDSSVRNLCINACFDNIDNVLNIIQCMSNEIKKSPNIKLIDSGNKYDVTSQINHPIDIKSYNQRIIKKYMMLVEKL